jgi:hypothetical protein
VEANAGYGLRFTRRPQIVVAFPSPWLNFWSLGCGNIKAMTLQKLARFSRKFMGWVYLTFGLLDITVSSYIFSAEHRREIALMWALQIPVSLFFIWFGGNRIYELKRKPKPALKPRRLAPLIFRCRFQDRESHRGARLSF